MEVTIIAIIIIIIIITTTIITTTITITIAITILSLGIFYSTNYGTNWLESNAPSSFIYSWFGISGDSTGQYVIAAGNRTSIYTSSTFGRTWAKSYDSTISSSWVSVASSSDAKLVAAASSYIFVDNEQRIPTSTPTAQPSVTLSSISNFYKSLGSPGANWISTVSDSSGQHVAAAQSPGFIYTSTSYGKTWIQKTFNPSVLWGNYITITFTITITTTITITISTTNQVQLVLLAMA